MKTKIAATVDEYIAAFPKEVQQQLALLRKTIKKRAPKAEESVSYGMPAYKYLGRPLVYFAGYEKHIGFYATPTGHDAFKKELAKYKQGKGSVQFPVTEKLPMPLIEKIIQFRVTENENKAGVKAIKPAAKKTAVPVVKKSSSAKPTDEEQVKAWLDKLNPEVKKLTDSVRKIIKTAAPKLNERIKWNAPSYYYKEDVVTFGPYRNGMILLIFHHPLIVKIKSPLLEGNYKDRRIVYLKDAAAVTAAKKELERIIKEHIQLLDK